MLPGHSLHTMPDSEWCWIPRLARVPLRAQPAHRSEQVSELLFGEPQQVLDFHKGWVFVRGWLDGYAGWVEAGTIMQAYYDGSGRAMVGATFTPLFHNGRKIGQVSFGALFPRGGKWITGTGIFSVASEALLPLQSRPLSVEVLLETFAGTPYHWGGKSPFGIDCSGLTQLIYRYMGRRLPRDAWQQAETTLPVTDPAPGDLVFFTPPGEERITHVALYLGEGFIFHATPAQGAHRSPLTGLYTHAFHSFRTFLTADFVI